jgi:hypothetical protein
VSGRLPEPWLRGPVAGIHGLLQPAAHAFIMAREDVDAAASGMTDEELWATPGGIAPVGFHLVHLSGSTNRLLTYARGTTLSDAQQATLAAERELQRLRPSLESMLEAWHRTVDDALRQLAGTPEASLLEPRPVGRARLPSTVLGLIVHSAEHAQRHSGQIITTAKVVRSARL